MVSRRTVLGGAFAATVAPQAQASADGALRAIAGALWTPGQADATAALRRAALAAVAEPEALIAAQEARAAQALSTLSALEAHRRLNAADFRAGRWLEIGGVRLSEIDAAAILAA